MKLYEYQILERKKPINIIPSDIHLFNKEFKKEFLEVNSKIIKDVYILENGVCYKRSILFDLFYNRKVPLKTKVKLSIKTFLVLLKSFKTEKVNKAILMTDCNSQGFFHWFGDVLQKLEALDINQIETSDYIFLLPEKFATSFALETLKIYDFDFRVIKNQKLFSKELLVIPQITPTGNYRPELMRSMRDRFQNHYKVESKKTRVFITRKKALKRTIINEEDLYQVLDKYGFDIIAMEDLTFSEQYKKVAESEILISLHGAGLTHMLWMEQNSRILEIRVKGDDQNNCYFSLASDLNLGYYYLLADKTNQKSTQETDFFVDINTFRNTLEKMVEDK